MNYLANQMMTTEVAPDEKKNTTCFIAGYLINARYFALLSEEEAGTMLTKKDSESIQYSNHDNCSSSLLNHHDTSALKIVTHVIDAGV